jgi:hypothetical protein
VNGNADVPNADYADSAGDATTLDGHDSTYFTTMSEVNSNADVPNADNADKLDGQSPWQVGYNFTRYEESQSVSSDGVIGSVTMDNGVLLGISLWASETGGGTTEDAITINCTVNYEGGGSDTFSHTTENNSFDETHYAPTELSGYKGDNISSIEFDHVTGHDGTGDVEVGVQYGSRSL